MPEYSSTNITPADGVQTPAMNGSTSGNYTLAELRNFILASKGLANGLASLDANGKLPLSQLPDLADDVIVVASYAVLPATGTAGKLYITADNNKGYRWDPDLATPAYVLLFNPADIDTIVRIISGAQVVGKAAADGNGNNIVDTYATKTALQEEVEAREAADNALSSAITAEAAQRKAYDSALNARVTNLEQKAGDYSIVQYRGTNAVPTGKAKYGLVKSILGKTRAWNQLVQNGDFSDGTTGWNSGAASISANDGVLTVTPSGSNGQAYVGMNFITNHVYMLIADFKLSSANNTTRIIIASPSLTVSEYCASNTSWQTVAKSISSPSGGVGYLMFRDDSSVSQFNVKNVCFYDLTFIFGAGNEPSTVADALAQLPALGQYNAYDAGSLVDTEVNGVVSRDTSDNVLDTLSLPETVTLRSAGSVADELDVESGEITRKVGSFDLGDYNWTSAGTDASGYYRWEISPSDLTIPNWRNAICGRFLIVQEHTAGVEEIVIHGSYKNVIYFTPTQYTSETLKTAMNGVSIICELATPDTPTNIGATTDNTIYTEGSGTIDTVQTQTPVIDNCLDVGYLAV